MSDNATTSLRSRLRLPVVCAPMFLVSGPRMVAEAAKAGLVGALPRQNARTNDTFAAWMKQISEDLERHEAETGQRPGPIAVNISNRVRGDDLTEALDVCRRHGVELIISAHGDPTELTKRVHDWGGQIFHDVTNLRFAEKAIGAGVDGLNCIGAGGGGHSGTVSHFALIPRVREMFDGTIVMAGAVGTGHAVRAAEVLGADLAYIGTRFIATEESLASPQYKQMLVDSTVADLRYTAGVAGVAANWLGPSIEANGLDPDELPSPIGGGFTTAHLPDGVRPWRDIWSAGQSIDLIHDIPPVAEVVRRLRLEYVDACKAPSLVESADVTPVSARR
jgi:nitronate monooxygenase